MKRGRLLITLAVAALVLAAALLWAARLAAARLHAVITQALGPRASVGNVALGWTGVELTQLRIRAAPGWPAADELRAERVQVSPDLRSLFGGPWRIRSVTVDGAYLSLLRTRDGRLRLLPALLEKPAPTTKQASTDAGASQGSSKDAAVALRIARVWLDDAAIELFDASVRQPAHMLRLEQLDAELGPISLPGLDQAMSIALDGRIRGPQQQGKLHLKGWVTLAKRDAKLNARLVGVDLTALQPYLLKSTEAGVRRGTLDLTLDALVQHNQLQAPGRLKISALELSSQGGVLGTFAGVPRQAVLAAISKNGHIDVKFKLEGNLDDPKFSLNENFALRLGAGMAETLGVSLSGVVEGVGGVIKGLFGK